MKAWFRSQRVTPSASYGDLRVRGKLELGAKIYDDWGRWVGSVLFLNGQWDHRVNPAERPKLSPEELEDPTVVVGYHAPPITRAQGVRRGVWRFLVCAGLGGLMGGALQHLYDVSPVSWWEVLPWMVGTFIGALGYTYEWWVVDRRWSNMALIRRG